MSNTERFILRYPELYHMAESGTWRSIQQRGLLSATALLDLFEIDGPERVAIESEWRETSVPIHHPVHGTAVIRDQLPMRPEWLTRVLVDTTHQQWYELLNRKTFFFPTRDRLNRLLKAPPYRNRPHDVITVDTRALVERHSECITLSHINSGFARFGQGLRCIGTFRSIDEYARVHGQREVAELAVEYHVPDIADIAISVTSCQGDRILHTVWER